MKKKILLILLLSVVGTTTFAQYYEPAPPPARRLDMNRVRIGAFLAPNISWMKPTAARSNDGDYRVRSLGSKVGFTWGLMADYYFTENYGIATGFQINATGGKIDARKVDSIPAASTVYRANFDYSLQYFEVPFNLKLRTDPITSSGIKVFGQVGLTAGVNIGKKATYNVGYRDNGGFYTTATGEKEKLVGSFTVAPVTLQLNVGGGIERPISPKMSLYLGLFFNNGFLPDATRPDKYDLGYSGEFSDGNIRLNSFSFRLGLFF
jgi:hypothetical protein